MTARRRAGWRAMLAGLLLLSAAAARAGGPADFRRIEPGETAIILADPSFTGTPLMAVGKNALGGGFEDVVFSGDGVRLARVIVNVLPDRPADLGLEHHTDFFLSEYPLFQDGDFARTGSGSAPSAIGEVSYNLVTARKPLGSDPLLACALFARQVLDSDRHLAGFFCDEVAELTRADIATFFARLGVRDVAEPGS